MSLSRAGLAKLRRRRLLLLLGAVLLALIATGCVAEDGTVTAPNIGGGEDGLVESGGAATGVQLLGLLTVLSLAPALLMMVTSFTRMVIVLSLVRNAVGVPQLPPNQVLVGIAFLLTVFVMAPVWKVVNTEALQPYLAGELTQKEAVAAAEAPVRKFMLAQTREADLELFVSLAHE